MIDLILFYDFIHAQRKNILVKAPVLPYKLPGRTGKSVLPVFPGNSPVFYLKKHVHIIALGKF